jgi:hypothetical protein
MPHANGVSMRIALAGAALLSMLNCLTAFTVEQARAKSVDRPPRSIKAILVDGRLISGWGAATTNEDRLDLLVSTDRVRLTAHLNWKQVASIEVRDRNISVARFRKQLAKFVLPVLPPLKGDSTPFRIEPLLDENSGEPLTASQTTVRSIQMEARLASWDNDSESDGLLLELFVLAATGHPTIVPGQLSATLTGLRQAITGGQSTLNRKPPMAQLEQWSVPVRVSDFADGRAVLKLPFRKLQPDRDLNIATETLLEISYGVPTVGVFKASQPDVLIRQPGFFRNQLFLSTGNRLLPSEAPLRQSRRPLSGDLHREKFRPTFQVR